MLTLRRDKTDISKSRLTYLVKHNNIKKCKAATFLTSEQTEVNCRLEAPASLPPVGSGQELGRAHSRSEHRAGVRVPVRDTNFPPIREKFLY